MKALKPWRVLRTRAIFADPPHIALNADDVALPDGRVVEGYYQIASRASCAVVARTEGGDLVMLRQYKHGARKVCLTFPGGRMESGETLLQTAQRELLEETGYEARQWLSLGRFPIHANQRVGEVELFRADFARHIAAAKSDDLEEMETILISSAESRAALARGDIALLGDAAALSLALLSWADTGESPPAR